MYFASSLFCCFVCILYKYVFFFFFFFSSIRYKTAALSWHNHHSVRFCHLILYYFSHKIYYYHGLHIRTCTPRDVMSCVCVYAFLVCCTSFRTCIVYMYVLHHCSYPLSMYVCMCVCVCTMLCVRTITQLCNCDFFFFFLQNYQKRRSV